MRVDRKESYWIEESFASRGLALFERLAQESKNTRNLVGAKRFSTVIVLKSNGDPVRCKDSTRVRERLQDRGLGVALRPGEILTM